MRAASAFMTLGVLAFVPTALAEPKAAGVEHRASRVAERAASVAASAIREAAASARAAAHVHSRGFMTWVWSAPRKSSKKLGYVRIGTSVPLRSDERNAGLGCPGGFVPVEPKGWVCLDRTATLDGSGRYLRGMTHTMPGSGALPYRYALSNGAPMYRRLPTPREARRSEIFYGKAGSFEPLSWGNRGHERLAEVRSIRPDSEVPGFLLDGGAVGTTKPPDLVRRTIPLGSMLAYTRSFEANGRTWLLSADGTVVPADRVRPFRTSRFSGLELGPRAQLPIAWMRKHARPKYAKGPDGKLAKSGDSWPVRTWTSLVAGAEVVRQEGRRYFETRERTSKGAPIYVAETDATVVRRRDKLPFSVGETDKWIIVSIEKGTLVAYEGRQPVFTTLVSPGVGGVPIKGRDPVEMSTTPLGIYRVRFKHVAATMSPEKGENRSFWIADVPYTQYFHAPFALHVAYWHEDFGEGMSAGCINLSPDDGKRLFGWTDPQVPDGWNGAASGGDNGPGTFVIVTR